MASGGPLVGIDLGTTYSALAFLNGYGRAELVPDAEGELLTPSLVWFPPRPGDPVVGRAARKRCREHPEGLIEFIKRDMGDPDWRRTLAGKDHTPTSISALILRHLVDGAATSLGERPEAAVITCPAYFGDPERQATSVAGQLAGLEVLGILNEPTAAALAYGLHHHAKQGRLRAMVYDLGGGTFDVTLLELEGRRVRVLATAGEHQLGGKDWDDELINWVADEFQDEHGKDPREDLGIQQELRRRCEAAKIELTSRDSARIFVQAYGEAKKMEVTRARFEELTRPLLQQTRTYVEQVLGQAGMGWGDVDAILPVGGSSRMPQVDRMLAECSGRPPQRDLDPDQAVALGAAYYAAILREEQGFEVKVLAPPRPRGAPGAAPKSMEEVPMVLGASLRFKPKPVITDQDRISLELDMEELARASPVFAVAARRGEAARPRRLQGTAAATATAAPPAAAPPAAAPPAPARPATARPAPGRPAPGRPAPGRPAPGAPPAVAPAPGRRPPPGARTPLPARRAPPTPARPGPATRRPVPPGPGRAEPPPARPARAAPAAGRPTRRVPPGRRPLPGAAPAAAPVRPAAAAPTPAPAPLPADFDPFAPVPAPGPTEPADFDPFAPAPAAAQLEPAEFDPFAPEEPPAPAKASPPELAPPGFQPPPFEPQAPGFAPAGEFPAAPPGFAPPGYGPPPGYPGYPPPPFAYPPPGYGPTPGFAPPGYPGFPIGGIPAFDPTGWPGAPEAPPTPAPPPVEEPPPQHLVSFSEMAGLSDAAGGLALAVVDVNSRSLAVLVFSQGRPKASVMIPARSELPAEKRSKFFTLNDNQTGVKIVVLEGDDPDPDRCVRVGECVISGLPARPKGQQVEVIYRYDASGLIRIAARDVATGQAAQAHLQRAID